MQQPLLYRPRRCGPAGADAGRLDQAAGPSKRCSVRCRRSATSPGRARDSGVSRATDRRCWPQTPRSPAAQRHRCCTPRFRCRAPGRRCSPTQQARQTTPDANTLRRASPWHLVQCGYSAPRCGQRPFVLRPPMRRPPVLRPPVLPPP
eukprot:scaffold6950_cov79-Isochrysis_galbana.AAC.1